jgi:hypothetical protein
MVGMIYDDGGVRPTATWPPSPMAPPAGVKPGVIPLRPLILTDVFNAALIYARRNPKTVLGLAAIVVVIAQIFVLLITEVLPMFAQFDEDSAAGTVTLWVEALAAWAVNSLANVLLSGMLTVVVGRAVFGASITTRETWTMIRGRFPALIGFTVLQGVVVALLVGLPYSLILATSTTMPPVAVLIGFPLLFLGLLAVVYLWTMVTFTPAIIVLEHMGIFASVKRSFALVRRSFWRIFGITLLATLVAQILAFALAWPFRIGGEVLQILADTSIGRLGSVALSTTGLSLGEVFILPFLAGVVVLLYTDRRMRAEAFDLVLQTGVRRADESDHADSTDYLWQIRQP